MYPQLRMVKFNWHVSFQEGTFLLYMYLDTVFDMNNVEPEVQLRLKLLRVNRTYSTKPPPGVQQNETR